MNPSLFQMIAALLFAIAILHTFAARWFERLAHRYPAHAGIWHLLGEVEIVFGFWAMILISLMLFFDGEVSTKAYIEGRNFTEPMFVFVIMVIAATRPVLQTAKRLVEFIGQVLPLSGVGGVYLVVVTAVPLLGSLITEPAAMTLAALILADQIFSRGVSNRLKYATLGILFVNISIGGTLTAYAAPPVLMVAGPWGWDSAFMLTAFGWKAAIAVVINGLGVTLAFNKELALLDVVQQKDSARRLPALTIILHFGLLFGVVLFAHYPPIFIGLFLLFMGIATAYPQHHDRLILREALLVSFFLAGLVVLGGQQQWWLQPALLGMDSRAVFFGAIGLTAFTDNAALTYLGSLVEGLSDEFKYALVAGAVAGGGLTVIANAPNPAGVAILRRYFQDGAISAGGLFIAAAVPTVVAAGAFALL